MTGRAFLRITVFYLFILQYFHILFDEGVLLKRGKQIFRLSEFSFFYPLSTGA